MTFTFSNYKQFQIKHFCSITKLYSFVLSILIASFLFSNTSFANSYHSHKDIQSTAIDFVRSQLPSDITVQEITAGNIDSRIQFHQCAKKLEAKTNNIRPVAKSQTIGVYCRDNRPWNIYITVKAKLLRKMLISTTTITRGELITANHLKLVEQEINNQKYFSDLSNVIGREARRTIRPNQVINSSMLQQALLVHKKESVLIYAQSKNIRVSMQGTALKNGRKNEMIQIRNNSSNKVIEALVIDRGVVAVNF